jgi:superfamily II DNA/RNA helicase
LAKGDTGVEQYVHRIGRTGRAQGATGVAVSYLNPATDQASAACLARLVQEAGQQVSPELHALAAQA